MGLKKLDLTKGSFEANGKEYFLQTSLTVGRFIIYQQLELEASFSLDLRTMFTELQKVRTSINEGKFLDSGIRVDNMLNGITHLHKKEPALLKICALFINTAGENLETITEQQITDKINDWKEYEVSGFFQMGLASINGFLDTYKEMQEAYTLK